MTVAELGDPLLPPALSDDRTEAPAIEVVLTGSTAVADFTRFARTHSAALHRIAYLLSGGDDHRAHDLTQLALERTFRAWSRVGHGNPFAYARQVLATARIDAWRRTRRETAVSPEMLPERCVGDPTTEVDDRERLVRALRLVPPKQRRVVVLRYLLDRSEQDVADELGISVGTVKSQGSRGLARLRTLLMEENA